MLTPDIAAEAARRSSDQIEGAPLPVAWTASTISLSAAPTISSQLESDKSLEAGGYHRSVVSPTPSQLTSPASQRLRGLSSSSSSCSKTLLAHQCDGGKDQIGRVRRMCIFVGLFFTIFLSGLDQTVTSTILTHIANDFRALDRIEWVPTIFMLCSTCLNILSGRIADVFDRVSVLLFSLAAFVLGAVLSGFSQSIVMFIVARGISGIACGGMLSLSIIIISDIVPLERRGKYLGVLQICFGASNAAGPLVGGLFADHFSWRAAFYADLCMGLLTFCFLALVLWKCRPQLRAAASATAALGGNCDASACAQRSWRDGLRDLDYIGIVVVVASIALIIVGMNLGGTILSWAAPVTVACLVSGVALLGVFVAVELRVPRLPLVPMWIFGVRSLVVSFAVTFLCGMTMFSIIFYMPVYFSAVFGADSMRAGLLVLPFGMSLSVSSFATGYFMSGRDRYRLFMRLGPAVMAVGVLLLALLSGRTSQATQSALLLVPGLGMGNVIVANVIAAQAATDAHLIATITPLCEFFLSIGGVFGVALFGAVYRNKLSGILAAALAGESSSAQALISEARKDVSVIYAAAVPTLLRKTVAAAYVDAMRLGLWVLLPLLAAAFVLALAMKGRPPASKKEAQEGIPLECIAAEM
ncbi:hypothetical protein GGI04_005332 [Coemansia thaxteri]|uniref:Major facilitator superfamily (MFS) profile domain-containing protein n=1 Tax=Coemansia thaxteri TaxID=2663907 RepID=A0A9W8BMC8_9FUNG|nr:hypothetical protein GGI04_005332 [Coemansia thaxteri]KAJ2006478.1 hypothetical protein H4R26_001355 [Coemansia thaxteri]KAJ2467016.1 hypothetical protein GGI02_004180 [Coemansia sp. RSA 2322]KAJ2484811.1 hypothetical protein EV174_002154 [Coemansia sp. RSA 2320]